MAQQAALEFDQLKAELYKEKERNISLQISLGKTDDKLNAAYTSECKKCKDLRGEIDHLKKEKQRALTIAKFAYQKFHQSVKGYERELISEKQQHKYLALMIEKKEMEVDCLKNQLFQNSSRTFRKTNEYII